MDDGFNQDFSLVFDGKGLPNNRAFTASNLVNGRPYRFYVVAYNHVDASPASDDFVIYACADPSMIPAPWLGDVQTSLQVPLMWAAP